MENDPLGKNPHEPGAKTDLGKAPVMRGVIGYFPRALRAVAEISAFGAAKYTWNGWETVPEGIERYGDAQLRHMLDQAEGQTHDQESKKLHAAHEAWNCLAKLELLLRVIEDD